MASFNFSYTPEEVELVLETFPSVTITEPINTKSKGSLLRFWKPNSPNRSWFWPLLLVTSNLLKKENYDVNHKENYGNLLKEEYYDNLLKKEYYGNLLKKEYYGNLLKKEKFACLRCPGCCEGESCSFEFEECDYVVLANSVYEKTLCLEAFRNRLVLEQVQYKLL